MTHILHLGHQPTDIAGANALVSDLPIAFDPELDSNGLRILASRANAVPLAIACPPPAGDMWLGLRYVAPQGGNSINQDNASFLEFRDAQATLIAAVRPRPATNAYHAIAHGDDTVEAASSFIAAPETPQWIDVQLAVGADITLTLLADGVAHSTATAPNTAQAGKPVHILMPNLGLHGFSSSRAWYLAHIAVLDSVSTIARRFARRRPDTVATFDQMTGDIAALADGNPATRIASTAPGQRLSFTLAGPTGAAAGSTIAAVHLKQIAQAGPDGPQAMAGFLRMGGVNHDADPVTVPALAPGPVIASWAANPADNTPWTDATLPGEAGILSA